ncbi:MAG TPA: glycosyltransferase [Thermoanaerobaculaceae bacterium]|nr:glycosyltransferase [Thermoanaerobaculaceae bacterium]
MAHLPSLRRRPGRAERSSLARPYPVTLAPPGGAARGRALFSYLEQPLLWPDDAPQFHLHSNWWESREIARILADEGFAVDAINWADEDFVPTQRYDVLFDISRNLARLAPSMQRDTLKILHCTGSDAEYQNAAEARRVEALRRRRGGRYAAQRTVADPELQARSLDLANACSLLGNETTLATYPERIRGKMRSVPVSASDLGPNRKRPEEFVPAEREFLWFFGWGAVHKGLDLLLEVFAERPQWTLNIVGHALEEPEFVRLYERELTRLPNIRAHGFLRPGGPEFGAIVRRCFSFVAPTCSEGASAAVVTCMQSGLFPIVSRDAGVSLPAGCGMYLENCSLEEIEAAVWMAYRLDAESVAAQIAGVQADALSRFSREAFRAGMTGFLRDTIGARSGSRP